MRINSVIHITTIDENFLAFRDIMLLRNKPFLRMRRSYSLKVMPRQFVFLEGNRLLGYIETFSHDIINSAPFLLFLLSSIHIFAISLLSIIIFLEFHEFQINVIIRHKKKIEKPLVGGSPLLSLCPFKFFSNSPIYLYFFIVIIYFYFNKKMVLFYGQRRGFTLKAYYSQTDNLLFHC